MMDPQCPLFSSSLDLQQRDSLRKEAMSARRTGGHMTTLFPRQPTAPQGKTDFLICTLQWLERQGPHKSMLVRLLRGTTAPCL